MQVGQVEGQPDVLAVRMPLVCGWSDSVCLALGVWVCELSVPLAGERIIHSQTGEQGVADFQRRLGELLSKGAAEGRIHKPIAGAG